MKFTKSTQHSHFGVLPINIRHSKDLSFLDKLVYCELTSLPVENGFISITNIDNFCNIFGNTEKEILQSFKNLKDKKHITLYISKDADGGLFIDIILTN